MQAQQELRPMEDKLDLCGGGGGAALLASGLANLLGKRVISVAAGNHVIPF